MKCLNLDVWILKVENWKLKIEISLWNVWKESKNLKIEMFEYGKKKLKCQNTKKKKPKMLEYWKLKIEMSKNWKLKCQNTKKKKTKMLEWLKTENWNV